MSDETKLGDYVIPVIAFISGLLAYFVPRMGTVKDVAEADKLKHELEVLRDHVREVTVEEIQKHYESVKELHDKERAALVKRIEVLETENKRLIDKIATLEGKIL